MAQKTDLCPAFAYCPLPAPGLAASFPATKQAAKSELSDLCSQIAGWRLSPAITRLAGDGGGDITVFLSPTPLLPLHKSGTGQPEIH